MGLDRSVWDINVGFLKKTRSLIWVGVFPFGTMNSRGAALIRGRRHSGKMLVNFHFSPEITSHGAPWGSGAR